MFNKKRIVNPKDDMKGSYLVPEYSQIEIEKNFRIMGKILTEKTPEINETVELKECSFEQIPRFVSKIVSN